MKCEECQVLVEEYFDGELDQRTARAVSVHMESCSSCHTALDQLSSEHRVYQSYDRDLDVSPAMWFNVQHRLAQKHQRRLPGFFTRPQAEFTRLISLRFSMATAVALMLLAVAATIAVMNYLERQETPKETALSTRPAEAQKQAPAETDVGDQPVEEKEPAVRNNSSEIRKGKVTGHRFESVARRLEVTGDKRNSQTPEQLVREAEKKYL